jgi:cobalt-zinc-cadmium efflux system membrane fusion protein
MPRNLAFLTAIALLASCGKAPAVQAEKKADPPAAPAQSTGKVVIPPDSPKLKQIKTEVVVAVQVPTDTVTAPGKVEANPNRLSHVVLPLTGRVTNVFPKIGDFVAQGQPVLTIESADADAAVSSTQQSQSVLTQSKSAFAKAQMDLDRQKDLFEHGAIPQKEVMNGQAIVTQAQAAVEQAQAGLEQNKRRLQILGITAGSYGQRITVRAPIAGKVLEMSILSGEYRNDLSAAVMTIADLSAVWITSDVPETSIRLVKPGEPVRIELSAYPGETFRGRVTLIGDMVDSDSRTVKVRAEMPNPGGRLKPEMFGTIQLSSNTEMRPTVPSAAIISTEGRTLVWRETAKGTFEKITVTTGIQLGDRVAILSGIEAGDRVVVDGVMLLAAN